MMFHKITTICEIQILGQNMKHLNHYIMNIKKKIENLQSTDISRGRTQKVAFLLTP